MDINRKILLIRLNMGLTQSEFARKLGMNVATISRLETGKIQPGPKFTSNMRDAFNIDIFGVSVENITFEKEIGEAFSMPAEPGPKIPVVGISDAGTGILSTDSGYPPGISDEWVSRPAGLTDKSAFAVRIAEGAKSMHPVLRPGMLAIISPNLEWNNGDICLIKTVLGEVNVKAVHQMRDRSFELRSINPAYSTIKLNPDEIRWIYPIIWWRRAK